MDGWPDRKFDYFLFVRVDFWRQKFCNWREKPAPETDASFLVPVSGACVIGISLVGILRDAEADPEGLVGGEQWGPPVRSLGKG